MNTKNNRNLTENAQKLRHEMTKEERRLWYDFLKGLPFTVNRQKVIHHYIADFYIAQAKLIIELDGSQHTREEQQNYDLERDRYFREQGLTVCRYTNLDIQQRFEGVCEDILRHLPRIE